jgi:hypothetical protein
MNPSERDPLSRTAGDAVIQSTTSVRTSSRIRNAPSPTVVATAYTLASMAADPSLTMPSRRQNEAPAPT